MRIHGAAAPWLNWIEQPPPKGQVTGSNPVGVTKAEIVEVSDVKNNGIESLAGVVQLRHYSVEPCLKGHCSSALEPLAYLI